MNRREFIGLSVSISSVALAGCLSSFEDAETGEFQLYGERTEVDIEGDNAMWTWIADIDSRVYDDVEVDVTITLYDGDGTEIDTFTRVVKNVESNTKSELSYIASPDVINSIVDYEVELTARES